MSSSASALIAPGAIVAGKYRLDTVIGEGGMGSVWSATHTGLGQPVAIKFISREFVTSAEALRRFDAEAKAAAQLRSRYVVQVYDNGTLEDGTPYIAMELLRGESVYQRVHRAGPVPLPEAAGILTQCCKALGRAHTAGIVHRDIKPDNIFLSQSQDDEAPVVKVLDFGIAKFSGGPADHSATRTGAVLGTPLYMSPEQARGLKTIDHRTDLYSLGLVAYTVLTGNLAFSSESFGDLLLQICTAPLPSLRANAPWLPPSMEAWFSRACAREPQDRYASAQEMAEALRAACEGNLNASAMPVLGQSSPGTGDIGYGQTTGVGASAVTQGGATTSGMSRSGPGTDAVTTPKSKAPIVVMAALGALILGSAGVAAVMTMSKKEAPAAAALPVGAKGVTPEATASGHEGTPGTGAAPAVTLAEVGPVVGSPDAGRAPAGHDAAPHAAAEPPQQAQAAGHPNAVHPAASPSPAATHAAGHPAATAGGAIDLGY